MRLTIALVFILAVSALFAERAFTQDGDSAAARSAVEKSLPLLQKVGPPFVEQTGCASCHHNVLPAMAVAAARERGFQVDEKVAGQNREGVHKLVATSREKMLLGFGLPGDATTAAYFLMQLGVDKQPADKSTDAVVHYLMGKQFSDGHWQPVAYRPPIEFSDISTTAVAARVIQMYAPEGRAEETRRRIALAAAWLARAQPATGEERNFQLLGLGWAKAKKEDVEKAVKRVMASQRADGGWSQLPGIESDAYATGQALVALHEAGGVSADDPAYRRGVAFLLKTQREDGSWLVQTRAIPLQRYFESGFPHGKNQWISAAGTSWATMALAIAVKR
ncbi:MAG TPA: prenyltransferase/squalene oxidase repeat-containing protein [Blastocatellia bacterium]|nr:prenyltransferase/squalene oxidase repeat-containing protein [Blastocatellia bacterium]